MPPRMVLNKALEFAADFKDANKRLEAAVVGAQLGWAASRVGLVKVNFDAAKLGEGKRMVLW